MHFTREPIIETIVTPKEGYNLLIRSSKVASTEEYLVEALEVVRFGDIHFYRSTEKPRAFLLPVTDYEVLEARETKVNLKAASVERGIKIGGGKKEEPVEEEASIEEEVKSSSKRDRKRQRRRRGGRSEEKETAAPSATDPFDTFMEVRTSSEQDKLVHSPSEPVISHHSHILLSPPPNLISERYIKEEPAAPLTEAPQSPEERVEELLDEITED